MKNKHLFNTIWALSGFAIIELIIIICMMFSEPKTVVEEKIVEVEVGKIVEVEKIIEVEIEKNTEDTVSSKKPTSEPTLNTKPTPEPTGSSPMPAKIENKDNQTCTYNISEADREMLARLIYLESNTESLECQKAIVSVIINRWQNGHWGSTLSDVVYAPNQFTPAKHIPNTTATQTNYQAVDEVLQNGCTVPSYVMYFRANYHFNWNGYVGYTKIDDVCFGYMNRDKKD